MRQSAGFLLRDFLAKTWKDTVAQLRRVLGSCLCMDRKWEVVAVYAPAPVHVVTRSKWGLIESERDELSPWAGLVSFKFTVMGDIGAIEAIEAVRGSGWFCGHIKRQFVFQAIEKFEKGQ